MKPYAEVTIYAVICKPNMDATCYTMAIQSAHGVRKGKHVWLDSRSEVGDYASRLNADECDFTPSDAVKSYRLSLVERVERARNEIRRLEDELTQLNTMEVRP